MAHPTHEELLDQIDADLRPYFRERGSAQAVVVGVALLATLFGLFIGPAAWLMVASDGDASFGIGLFVVGCVLAAVFWPVLSAFRLAVTGAPDPILLGLAKRDIRSVRFSPMSGEAGPLVFIKLRPMRGRELRVAMADEDAVDFLSALRRQLPQTEFIVGL